MRLRELIKLRGWTHDVHIGEHTFFAWKPGDPTARVAPDLYLVDGPPLEPGLLIWEAWKPYFRRPRWVLEVVSKQWRKDYHDRPSTYAQLSCSEMVIFDPLAVSGRPAGRRHPRAPLTIYRLRDDGRLHSVYSGNGPAYSPELKVWLAATVEDGQPSLRLWLDKEGKQVVPTEAEANQESNRRADEANRRADEANRRADEERAKRERVAQQRDLEKLRADEAEHQIDELEHRVDELEHREHEANRRVDEERAARERMAERMRRAGLDSDEES